MGGNGTASVEKCRKTVKKALAKTRSACYDIRVSMRRSAGIGNSDRPLAAGKFKKKKEKLL